MMMHNEAAVRPRSSPRVVYWNNIPSPYMVERFNAVADRGNIDLETWFSRRTAPDRSWLVDERAWRFPYRYLPWVGPPRYGMAVPLALLRRERPDLLVSLYGAPEFVAGWLAATVLGIRTAFWAEVTFDAWVPRRAYREWLKRHMFPRVNGVLTAGEDGRRFVRRYGTPEQRIFIARHAVDIDHYAAGVERAKPQRKPFRHENGLTGIVFVYVGRLWGPKGIFDLLDAFALLCKQGTDATLAYVGDGIDERVLQERAALLGDRVIFPGFRQKDELPMWYAASDVFVFPTLGDPYGMVVDEAMACGLPIISTNAAGEIGARVQEGRNGFVVRPGEPVELAAAMARMAADPRRRSDMGAESRRMIDGHTPERWASDFEAAVSGILEFPRRGGRR
jgi:glycosyltransferase involved in cell wall biosynthesis